jgi:glyoxylase-like metal-dependent hydrolase (beta-lactamase superfamily II)
VLNLGDLSFSLKDIERSPESEWRPRYGDLFEKAQLFPSNCFHIIAPSASILVDAGDYSRFTAGEPSYIPENYKPPPPLTEQLTAIGVPRTVVTYVIITHAHYDHYAGVTMEVDGKMVPTFPKAKHLLGRQDWENPEMQKALVDPNSRESLTLGVLQSAGLLYLTEGEYPVTPGITTIAAPGESPGHTIVRIRSGVRTTYFLGDMFHHALEVENIDLMAQWDDAVANKASRRALIEDALAKDALLLPAHMPPGKLTGSVESPRFVPL